MDPRYPPISRMEPPVDYDYYDPARDMMVHETVVVTHIYTYRPVAAPAPAPAPVLAPAPRRPASPMSSYHPGEGNYEDEEEEEEENPEMEADPEEEDPAEEPTDEGEPSDRSSVGECRGRTRRYHTTRRCKGECQSAPRRAHSNGSTRESRNRPLWLPCSSQCRWPRR